MATLSRIPLNNTREICDRLQKKTVSPKTCHTSPRSQQGKARSGLVRRSSEAPQLCTSCGFVWGDNGPFTAVLMAKCCLFVPPKIGPAFGWYPVRRSTTKEEVNGSLGVKKASIHHYIERSYSWEATCLPPCFLDFLGTILCRPCPQDHWNHLKLIFPVRIHVPSQSISIPCVSIRY